MLRALWDGARVVSLEYGLEPQFNSRNWEVMGGRVVPSSLYERCGIEYTLSQVETFREFSSNVLFFKSGLQESAVGLDELSQWLPYTPLPSDLTSLMAG